MDADSDDREGMDIETTSDEKKTKQISKKDRNENLPWVEKYRPADLSELISHTQITDTITKLIDGNKLPHLLFYGPPGTGKTSTILAVAKKIFGKNYSSMILELNASDDRGIDVVRKEIKDFANTRNIFSSGIKLIVLDEADAMTSAAQAALRRVIEKYTRTTRFCLICNYLNRIIPALQSRCTRFRFGPLRDEAVIDRLNQVAKIEGVNISKTAMDAVVKLGHGDMRKCLNILQSASMAYDVIDQDQIYQCTGHPLPKDISQILEWLLNQNFKSCMDNIITLQRMKGLALQDIITELHTYVLRIQINAELRIFLLEKLADIEFRLATGSSEKLNLGALVSAFQLVRDRIASDNKMIS